MLNKIKRAADSIPANPTFQKITVSDRTWCWLVSVLGYALAEASYRVADPVARPEER